MTDIYLLYGPPGVGKGTAAQLLPADRCLGVGQLLRAQNKGLDGNLMSDAFVNRLVATELKKRTGYVVLDGYPRTAAQANFLMTMKDIKIRRVYELTCPDENLTYRLSLRETCTCGASYHPTLRPPKEKGICDRCHQKLFRRPDDAPEIVKKRLAQYHEVTEPVLKVFGDLVKKVDVAHDFMSKIQQLVQTIIREQEPQPPRTQRHRTAGYEHT